MTGDGEGDPDASGGEGDPDASGGDDRRDASDAPVRPDGGMSVEPQEESDLATLDRMLRARVRSYPIAKKEFYDTIRSQTLLVLSAAFVALFIFTPALALYFRLGEQAQQAGQTLTTNQIIPGIWGRIVSVIVPIIAIAVTYAAIAGEGDRGTLKVLLSLPYSRREVVVGKLLGRSAVVAIPLVISLLLSAFVFVPSAIAVKPLGYLQFVALTGFLAVVFVGFSVAVSAWAPNNRYAMIGTVGTFVYFFALWNPNANGIGRLLTEYTGLGGLTVTKIQLFWKLLNPTQTYQTLLDSFVVGLSQTNARAAMFGGLRRRVVAKQLGESVPFYLTDWMAVVFMLLWLVVPLVFGVRAFARRDL